MRSTAMLVSSLLLSTGCLGGMAVRVDEGTLRRASAGATGCPSSEIAVSGYPREVKAGEGPVEWRAECRGHRFVCSASGDVATCTEELR